MITQRAGWTVLLGVTLGFWGCTDAAVTDAPVDSRVHVAAESPAQSVVHDVTWAFALAMADPQVRVDLRDALRASPLTEHKLVLQRYLATPAGERLMRAAAAAAGVPPGAILRRVTRLPEMDLYLPFREHRRTWRATGNVVVAGLMDVDAEAFVGYRTDGSVVTARAADGAPSAAVVMIHPAERKGRRIGARPVGTGDVVEEVGDGGPSGQIVWVTRDGDSTVVDLAELASRAGAGGRVGLAEECDPDQVFIPCDDDEPSFPIEDTTRLASFTIGFGDGVGSAEIEYRAKYYEGAGL